MVSKAKNVSAEQKAKIDKSANVTGIKPAKRSEIGTKAKVLASDVKTTSKTLADNLAPAGDGTKEKPKEATAKDIKVTSNMASENKTDTDLSKPKDSETKAQESVVVPEDTPNVVDTGNATVSESVQQADLPRVDVEAKAEPMEVGETRSEVAEPMDVESCAEASREKLRNIEDLPPKHSESQSPVSTPQTRPDVSQLEQPTVPPQSTEATPKPADTNTDSPQTAIKTPEIFVKASFQVQQSTLPEPESTAQGLEAMTDGSQTHAGSSPEAALEAELTLKELETKTVQKGMSMAI